MSIYTMTDISLCKMPYDIIWYIAHYIDDIDIRRTFNIYDKIDVDRFRFLNRVIRTNKRNHWNFTRYNFVENNENTIHRYMNIDGTSNICDDLMDVKIVVSDFYVSYKLYFYKLKKIPHDSIYNNATDIYYKGPLENDYYWQNIGSEFVLE